MKSDCAMNGIISSLNCVQCFGAEPKSDEPITHVLCHLLFLLSVVIVSTYRQVGRQR
jgi:hypothetical protein